MFLLLRILLPFSIPFNVYIFSREKAFFSSERSENQRGNFLHPWIKVLPYVNLAILIEEKNIFLSMIC